ncbi:MAG TPA: hypothetical protein VFE50_18085 [Cyclobacteriaceae bacterium]|nr:hypothetical protein [Cyclobacteriaceae bacterium]
MKLQKLYRWNWGDATTSFPNVVTKMKQTFTMMRASHVTTA